jgi:hypothetical protein
MPSGIGARLGANISFACAKQALLFYEKARWVPSIGCTAIDPEGGVTVGQDVFGKRNKNVILALFFHPPPPPRRCPRRSLKDSTHPLLGNVFPTLHLFLPLLLLPEMFASTKIAVAGVVAVVAGVVSAAPNP